MAGRIVKPQPGFQEKFLSSSADIVIGGGGAGVGKSFAELMEAARHTENPEYRGVIFRRTSPQIRNPGGLWDTSAELYLGLGAEPKETTLEWIFPSGAKIKFAHLQYETDKYDWQGTQNAFIGWDELTHFTESQFFYLLSRNRSTSGVRPYVRATCNPDADSWVAKLIAWWIDKDGFAIPERDGVVRWFYRDGETLVWGNSREELQGHYPSEGLDSFKSLTYIQGDLSENRILNEKDPGYLANLKALPYVERMRLLEKNWKIRAVAGNVFKREWFRFTRSLPPKEDIEKANRYWDLAGSDNDTADRSAGVPILRVKATSKHEAAGGYIIPDIRVGRWTSKTRNDQIYECLAKDNKSFNDFNTYVEQVPGMGAEVIKDIIKNRPVQEYILRSDQPQKKKYYRAQPLAVQLEIGNVWLFESAWNEDYIQEFLAFSENEKEYAHDDMVDATSGAFNMLTKGGTFQIQ